MTKRKKTTLPCLLQAITAVAGGGPVLPPNPFRLRCEPGFASVYLYFIKSRQLSPSLCFALMNLVYEKGKEEGNGRREKREKKGNNILCKRPRERLLTADLLPADERVDRDGDGAVDVLRGAVFGQAHLAKGLADAHDGFEVADLAGFNGYFVSIYFSFFDLGEGFVF